MTAEWRFEPKRRSQKSRDPMQASFFTNSSIDDDTHALVREAIQNSLDAKTDAEAVDPVRVRFKIGTHSGDSELIARYIPEDAWLHFNASDNGLQSPPVAADDCRYLVYEDFNTEGLVGDERAFEAENGNSFYFFMRAEGQSGKHEGERGRHGIGKYVFPYTSGIRMFMMATVRASDSRCLIAGQSVLKSHQVSGERFTPDGWWGHFEKDGADDYFALPIEDLGLFSQLRDDFDLARESDQTGLSLILPYIQDEVTAEKLSEHVVGEYFWPILSGQLVVEVIEQGKRRVIDGTSIRENLDDLLPAGHIEQIAPYIALAHRALHLKDFVAVELSLPEAPSMPKWDKDYLSKGVAKEIHEELAKPDAFVRIRCPLYVCANAALEAKTSHFDIFLSKDITDTSRKPRFVREGIIIPEDRVPKVRGYTSMVVIDSGDVATLLGDSENPAHTEWEKNATKFKGKYKWGPTTIDFVRLSVGKFLNLMSQGDEEEDRALLSDIFFLDAPENEDDVPDARKRRKKIKPGPDPAPPIDPPPPARPRTFRLSKLDGGFVVRGPRTPLLTDRSYKVLVAYDFSGASKSRAMKQWSKNDFDLERADALGLVEAKNMGAVVIGGNTVEFQASTSDFSLIVHGFDSRRDLIVEVESEAVLNEEV
ncbi:hypothetical protein R0135_14185 [Congregibacter variabilis]|uniref:Uncharacterized protein n=1 Tax=Congregibacter variabilis TaxID=3081200 RepID=A0ABZ0I492_9GAMM|nr:hypothetical protein R0135_14185 [Congregibacter sp. IMCC43200]